MDVLDDAHNESPDRCDAKRSRRRLLNNLMLQRSDARPKLKVVVRTDFFFFE